MRAEAPTPRSLPGPISAARVVRLPVPESDVSLVAAIRAGWPDARTALFDRYADDVERVLYRILGPDTEAFDLLQDVFIAALTSIDGLKKPEALRSWLTGIAVRKARKCIRRRRRWRFIQLVPPSALPEREAITPSAEVSEALRSAYKVLGDMPADERIAFALRHIDGMELTQVAEAMGISLATVKRRLGR